MVMASPLNVPPDQLNVPPIVTGLGKLMVPLALVKLMVAVDAGTPAGVQLSAVNQSLETEPFQVDVAAEHHKTFSKTDRQSRGSLIVKQVCRFIRDGCPCRSFDFF
jgi:hypothetical protein